MAGCERMRAGQHLVLAFLLGTFTGTALRAGLLLSGRVIDQGADPVAGAEVFFRLQDDPTVQGDSRTDSVGHYEVNLLGVLPPTIVSPMSWAAVKARPSAKVASSLADTVIAHLLAVTISHDEIQPYSRDSLLVPGDGILDFVVDRISASDSTEGVGPPIDTGAADPGDDDAADQDDTAPPSSGGSPSSVPPRTGCCGSSSSRSG